MILRFIPFCCLLLSTLATTLCSAAKSNVLFIAIDDLRADLACYGNPQIISPNIDALATSGTLFNRAYCQQAVCNPSRSSMLTGLRLDDLKIWDLPTHFRQRRPNAITLPQMFLNNGYHTQCIGTIFHNWRQDVYKGDRVSWSVPEMMHYNSHGNDKAIVAGELPPDLSDVPKCEIRDVPDNAYFDGRVAEHAVQALQAIQNRPFFLAVGFWKPHSHFNAPKKYWDLYDPASIQLPANQKPPTDVPVIALHDSREILRSYTNSPNQYPTDQQSREMRRGYYANISYMDAQVGKVLSELDRLDLRSNTIIVLWSDHGFHLGEKGLWAKTSNFELDARVPLIISTPQHNKFQRTNSLVELLDIYPTLADLCNLQPPPDLAGESLVSILKDPRRTVKDLALTQHCRPAYPANGVDPKAIGYSIRTDRYRYTEWRDFQSGKVLAHELYDHKRDPHETANVISKASLHLRNKLAEALQTLVHSPQLPK
ncbi:MAG: sulfatase [Planctomycetaceae bacterium]|nr:sulfatase [Planctomycetaceae bacterium]